jgi:OOP family OmpA-OmpF porin
MGTTSSPDDLEDLRTLLLAPEREAIDALRARLDDPVARGKDFARALPEAIAQCSDDRRLTAALQAPVEHVITASVRRNPRPLADALFPVIGPAIRKAIAHTLSGMLESMNRTVEHSVSARALGWRLTAWRTGKPFAEIVLLNTLVYRVEQVFLIHTQTGLLLQHVTAESVTAQDADMVSGMLTAIRDFARDSFGTGADDTLDTFRVGELAGVIEQGPHAYLAAVVRGTVPPDLRQTLQRALETIHLQQAADLEAFEGDAAPFDDTRPVLHECLEARYRERDGGRRRLPWGWIAVASVVVLALGAWGVARWQESRAFAAWRAALDAQPGLVVVDAHRAGGRFVLRGLRDPLAPDPAALLAASGLSPDRVAASWQLYQAMDPRLALPRARAVLRPPGGVTLAMRDGTLVASGEAPGAWIRDAMLLARTLPGVSGFDPSGLENAELRTAARRIEAGMLQFEVGTAALLAGQDAALGAMSDELTHIDGLARQWGIRYRVVITGHTSADGPEERNGALSRERAAAVVAALPREGLASLVLDARGVGSSEPVAPGAGDEAKQRNRRVSVRIEPLADRPQP